MSRWMIRPLGPVPVSRARSTPARWASFRARGETRRRPPGRIAAVDAGGAGPRSRGDRRRRSRGGAGRRGRGRGGLDGRARGGSGGGRGRRRGRRAAGAGLAALGAAAGAAPPPTTAPMSSFGSAMIAIRPPTGTAVPGVTRSFRRTPEPNASSSMSALSVSISAMMSPPEIRSPSCLSQRSSFPVSIASDSFGITTLVTAMARSPSWGNGENRQTAQSLRISSTICCFDGVFSRSRFLA